MRLDQDYFDAQPAGETDPLTEPDYQKWLDAQDATTLRSLDSLTNAAEEEAEYAFRQGIPLADSVKQLVRAQLQLGTNFTRPEIDAFRDRYSELAAAKLAADAGIAIEPTKAFWEKRTA